MPADRKLEIACWAYFFVKKPASVLVLRHCMIVLLFSSVGIDVVGPSWSADHGVPTSHAAEIWTND